MKSEAKIMEEIFQRCDRLTQTYEDLAQRASEQQNNIERLSQSSNHQISSEVSSIVHKYEAGVAILRTQFTSDVESLRKDIDELNVVVAAYQKKLSINRPFSSLMAVILIVLITSGLHYLIPILIEFLPAFSI
ncbi:hypothetical protein RYZ26_06260 [Terasakiella sp. A23]|uniref:hypothetical protein n=1 Tax=Terasakiella sp. FCG-A23 TaxID=3080561 RepID=UPI002954C210|nr:hypothetical protein [Terasakiella sp. A23]MDV7339187.1 hypothetical protein [Terasakiella sp. A23]